MPTTLLYALAVLALLSTPAPTRADPVVRGPDGRETASRRAAIVNLYASAPSPEAAVGYAGLCDRAIRAAAARHDVPLRLMRAVSLVESGKTVPMTDGGSARVAWPWTVNMEGAGRWFDDRASAIDYVQRERGRGARSFDVGCMQVNHLWHGEAFRSIADMFDPEQNADYAARFLRSLKEEAGDWFVAAGNYHSRTPKFHQAYRAKVKSAAASLSDGAPQVAFDAPPPPPRSRTLIQQPGRRLLDAPDRDRRAPLGAGPTEPRIVSTRRGGVPIRLFAPRGAARDAADASSTTRPRRLID